MAISEFEDIKCGFCGNKGFTGREEIIKTPIVTQDNEIRECTIWKWICKYCGQINESIWQVEG